MKPIRVISVITATLLLAYIITLAALFRNSHRDDVMCSNMIVTLQGEKNMRFVSEANITDALKQAGLNPAGKLMRTINTNKMERELLRNEMLDRVDVYKTPSGIIRVDVKQKIPILRIISAEGNFYVDIKGSLMPVSRRYTVRVPLASGYVRKEFATADLYEFALFLQGNEFWNNQIEQIYVHPDHDVELVPLVGNHRILLGTLDDFREKLDNLQLFYEQAIPKVGWGKYSIINLKFKNQIVCTKK
ncbi:MAG: cell division protein FtsQ [Tannerellaceae bacterium]|jgi:cell division protein FtsQ|nr:cell division protein FtsQ [Tannerellaceae bacterium]